MRIDWVHCEEIPEVLRACASVEIQSLAQSCAKMSGMKVERRKTAVHDDCRLSCRCAGPRRGIRVRRPSLGETLEAFERVVRLHCVP